jgi:hypothetical protein
VTDDALFVTGAQRSGTTLLEKLLASQPGISMLSQPFPLLFVEVKRAFLRSLGNDDPYPLGHLFLEKRYPRGAFIDFLQQWRAQREQLWSLLAPAQSYSGQYTHFTHEQLDEALAHVSPENDDFAAVVNTLNRRLSRTTSARWFGSKETMCEEYVPALLDAGFRCTIILRDPRDILASLNYGCGHEFGGALKPLLFNARSWRKSVAVALAMEEHPRFRWCRYEDLVRDAPATLTRLAPVAIDGTDWMGEIRDEAGNPWPGNSSHAEHRGISSASVGIHRDVLPAAASRLMEAACLPELQLLGYETEMTAADARRELATCSEPYATARTGMESDFATPENIAAEIERFDRIRQQPSESSTEWFLFERAHARLREGLGA